LNVCGDHPFSPPTPPAPSSSCQQLSTSSLPSGHRLQDWIEFRTQPIAIVYTFGELSTGKHKSAARHHVEAVLSRLPPIRARAWWGPWVQGHSPAKSPDPHHGLQAFLILCIPHNPPRWNPPDTLSQPQGTPPYPRHIVLCSSHRQRTPSSHTPPRTRPPRIPHSPHRSTPLLTPVRNLTQRARAPAAAPPPGRPRPGSRRGP